MTPRQFSYLVKRHKNEQRHQELLAGIIAANIVNFSMRAPDRATCPADFMPSEIAERNAKEDSMDLTMRLRQRLSPVEGAN